MTFPTWQELMSGSPHPDAHGQHKIKSKQGQGKQYLNKQDVRFQDYSKQPLGVNVCVHCAPW